MRKLKLDVDALEVTSFNVAEAAGGGGTVVGRGDPPIHTKAACPPETGSCYNVDTCEDDCPNPGTLTAMQCTGVTFCVVC